MFMKSLRKLIASSETISDVELSVKQGISISLCRRFFELYGEAK